MNFAGIIPNLSLRITVLRPMKQVQRNGPQTGLGFCSVVFVSATGGESPNLSRDNHQRTNLEFAVNG